MEKVICCNCDRDCTSNYWMCDNPDWQDHEWCPDCFDGTACGAGVHGEGCPTQVFNSPAIDAHQN